MVNPYQSPSCETSNDGKLLVDENASHAGWNLALIFIIGLAVPGLPSMLIRRDRVGLARMLVLAVSVPIGFIFFGPVWGEWLFANTQIREWGLYPFLILCVCVPILSVLFGVRDLSRARHNATRPTREQVFDA